MILVITAGRLHILEMNTCQLLERDEQHRVEVPLVRTGRRGRPSVQVTREQLEFLRQHRFKWTTIAQILGNCFSFICILLITAFLKTINTCIIKNDYEYLYNMHYYLPDNCHISFKNYQF